jgi:hypothetical protein
MKPVHGNNHKNDKEHHLYEIYDKEDEEIYKYGISDKPIGKDGLSSRLRDQLALFNNVVGWLRFVGEIILTGIAGRKKAEDIEDEYIDKHEEEHGHRPRGNRK